MPPNENTYWRTKKSKKCSMHGITIEQVSAQESIIKNMKNLKKVINSKIEQENEEIGG